MRLDFSGRTFTEPDHLRSNLAIGEDSGRSGRADLTVRCSDETLVFEFKTVADAPEGTALAQLREKRYADKYRHLNQPIHLIGVEFSRATRNVSAFEVERG